MMKDYIACKVNLWDTGGAERFRTITDAYYRESVGAILVFSLDIVKFPVGI